jgi:hypothetical protein
MVVTAIIPGKAINGLGLVMETAWQCALGTEFVLYLIRTSTLLTFTLLRAMWTELRMRGVWAVG